MTQHLSHEQLCDVLLADTSLAVEGSLDDQREHLSDCLICAAELELLSNSVSGFRALSIDYAERATQRQLQRPFASLYQDRSHKFFSQPLSWAAAALVLAVTLPLGLRRHDPVPTLAPARVSTAAQSTESDEALLEGINQDLSSSVPSPMKALADPTGSETQAQSNNTQRKN